MRVVETIILRESHGFFFGREQLLGFPVPGYYPVTVDFPYMTHLTLSC
jgi:hypothetical protein